MEGKVGRMWRVEGGSREDGEGEGGKYGVVETVGRMWRVERGSDEERNMVWYMGWSHVLKGAVMQYCYPHTTLCNSCYQSLWVVTNLGLSLFVN